MSVSLTMTGMAHRRVCEQGCVSTCPESLPHKILPVASENTHTAAESLGCQSDLIHHLILLSVELSPVETIRLPKQPRYVTKGKKKKENDTFKIFNAVIKSLNNERKS